MIKILELFAGVGAQVQGLRNAGIEYESIGISEIDRYALQAYELLHGPVHNYGDISAIDATMLPDFDLLTYSFPCQDISITGQQRGLDEGTKTRSSLLWECRKIIETKRPRYLLMENVKNLVGPTHKANFDKWLKYLTDLGYHNYWKVLNAVDYGCPQSRERVFVVSMLDDTPFEWPKPQSRERKIRDILDDNPPANTWMNQEFVPNVSTQSANGLIQVGTIKISGHDILKRVYSPDGICPTLTTMSGGNQQPKILIDGRVRKLTPGECWRLMGLPFPLVEGKLSNTQLYKLAGNSIAVPCLEAIFKQLFKTPFKNME